MAALLPLVLLAAGACSERSAPAVVIGKASPTPLAEIVLPSVEPGPSEAPLPPSLAPKPALGRPTSSGPPAPVAFRGAVDVPDDLLFFLVAGSDARPGQEVTTARADSIHVVALDPVTRRGTVLGLPRDSYVEIPGHGTQKINAALALGGPDLLVRTIRKVTGLPVSYYAVTGFDGIVRMADELGGLDVYVAERMDDADSGARFERGWHHMDGRQVLAFTRNRHVPGGDFARSKNQGAVILHALEKARASISDDGGLRTWLQILYRYGRVDMRFEDAVRLARLARTVLPADVTNVVASGRATTASNGQSVVLLDDQAFALFRDVGADAEADGDASRPASGGPPAATAAPTAAPSPTPSPLASPTAPPLIPFP